LPAAGFLISPSATLRGLSRALLKFYNDDFLLSRGLLLFGRKVSQAKGPLNLGCCAFAGDRGLLYPELIASATEKEAAEVKACDCDGYYPSNITCEMACRKRRGQIM
jgi:hypothetical protein